MSNPVANHLYVYGPRKHVDQFFAEFQRGGLGAHVPMPDGAVLSEDPAKHHRNHQERIHLDYWGAFGIYPGIYWRYADAYGVSVLTADLDRAFKPEETQLDNVRKLNVGNRSKPIWPLPPGYVLPSEEDAVAYFKFYSPWYAPDVWFGKIATTLYGSGLRFVMKSIDLTNVGDDGSNEIMQFWSVEGPGEFYQEGHWASCLDQSGGHHDDDEFLFHEDESAALVQQSGGKTREDGKE